MTLALFHLSLVLFLVLLGCLIKYGKAAWLIAGYNTSSKEVKEQYDVEALWSGSRPPSIRPGRDIDYSRSRRIFQCRMA